jgi:hypothetical protein
VRACGASPAARKPCHKPRIDTVGGEAQPERRQPPVCRAHMTMRSWRRSYSLSSLPSSLSSWLLSSTSAQDCLQRHPCRLMCRSHAKGCYELKQDRCQQRWSPPRGWCALARPRPLSWACMERQAAGCSKARPAGLENKRAAGRERTAAGGGVACRDAGCSPHNEWDTLEPASHVMLVGAVSPWCIHEDDARLAFR